jgi:hypothetical protein
MANPTENKAVTLNIIPPIALLLASLSCPATVSFVGALTDDGAVARGLFVGNKVGRDMGNDTGANVVMAMGTGVGGTSGANVVAVTGKGVGGTIGADVVTGNGVGAARGAGVVAVTGRGVGGGMLVPTGAETGKLTGAGAVPPLLSIHAPVASKPTQSPTNRLEQSKYGTNTVSVKV